LIPTCRTETIRADKSLKCITFAIYIQSYFQVVVTVNVATLDHIGTMNAPISRSFEAHITTTLILVTL